MSKEIQFDDVTGKTCYVVMRNSIGQLYNTVTTLFENYNGANYANYKIAATEQGVSGFYTADFPAVAAGVYYFVGKEQAGGSPATTDVTVATGDVDWSGTVVGIVERLYATIGEGAFTFVQMMRLMFRGIVAGKTTGATSGGGTFRIRDSGDTKDAVVVNVDANGNRTGFTTLDGT